MTHRRAGITLPIEEHVAFAFQGVQVSATYEFPETEVGKAGEAVAAK